MKSEHRKQSKVYVFGDNSESAGINRIGVANERVVVGIFDQQWKVSESHRIVMTGERDMFTRVRYGPLWSPVLQLTTKIEDPYRTVWRSDSYAFQTKTMPTNILIEKGGKIRSIAAGCDPSGLLANKVSEYVADLLKTGKVDVKDAVNRKAEAAVVKTPVESK